MQFDRECDGSNAMGSDDYGHIGEYEGKCHLYQYPSLSLSLVFITFLQQINIVGGKKQTVKRMTEFITFCCTIYAAITAPVLSFFEKLAIVIYIISGFVDALSDQIAFQWSVQEIYLVKEDQEKSSKYLSLMDCCLQYYLTDI